MRKNFNSALQGMHESRDCPEQWSAGADVQRAEQIRGEDDVKQSEAKFRSAFENAAVGFVMRTPDGCLVDANPAYCRITGYEIDELRVLPFSHLVHPDD